MIKRRTTTRKSKLLLSALLIPLAGIASLPANAMGISNMASSVWTLQQAPIKISGTVSDDTNAPLPGASVTIKGTQQGVATDLNGKFTIEAPEDAILVVSFLGYETAEIPVNGRSTINISLALGSAMLEQTVVLGYSSKEKSQLSSSVSVLSAEQLEGVTTPSVGNMLQGKASGVVVSNSSGQPGKSPKIVIRGTGSLSAGSDPLYVVDGVIGGTANPNDIASITILKDAAATSLYGSRAANGVIVITTKSGQAGETKITFNSSVGFNERSNGNFDVMNTNQYYDYTRGMYENDYTGKRENYIEQLKETNPNPTSEDINNYLEGQDFPTTMEAYLSNRFPESLKQTSTNWQDLAFKTGITQNYELSASGGSQKTQFYISGNYYNEEGTLTITGFERFNGRVNVEHFIGDKFKITARVNGRHQTNTNDPSGALYQSYINLPIDNPYNEDGSLKTGQEQGWIGRDASSFMFPLAYNWNRGRSSSLQGDLKLDYYITDWLSFSTTNRVDFYNAREESYADPITPGGQSVQGSLSNEYHYSRTLLTSNLLTASHSFGLHDISGILGAEFQGYYADGMDGNGVGIASGLEILNVTAEPRALGGYKTENAFNSYFLQGDYSYDDRYFVTASARRDGSSKFGANNRYGNFFAVGASWILSNEEFLKQSNLISYLKLRASYGTTGNASGIDNFIARGLYNFDVNYAGIPGAFPRRLPNPDLTWERAFTTNLGVNIELVKRVNIALDYYNRDVKDQLFDVPLSSATGFYWQTQNIGNIRNRGFEIEINSTNIQTDNFTWQTGFNIGFNKNKVMELYDGQAIDDAQRRIIVGQDMRTFYMRKWLGVDPENGSPLWEKVIYDENGNATGREATSSYNQATLQIAGTATPDFTGGFSNTLRYKNLTLSAFLNFVKGNQIYNSARELFDADGAYPTYNSMVLQDDWNRWEKPGDIATHPKAVLGGGGRNTNKESSRYLEDGSYLRLRNVSLSYQLPKRFYQSLNVSDISLFFSGDNLWTLTNFSGMDPEVVLDNITDYGAGVAGTKYPISKKFLFGLSIKL